MTLTDAKIYVAKILGMQNDTNALSLAEDSIKATYAKWQNMHNWSFMLMENSYDNVVDSCVIAVDGVTVNHATIGTLYFVNVGQTVTGTGIPAGTTISAVTTSASTYGVTSFTLSQAASPGTVSITFSAYIPVVSGTDLYNLPQDCAQIYTARLIDNPRTLEYIKNRDYDRRVSNQTNLTTPTHYTTYKYHRFNAAVEHAHIKLFGTPGAADRLYLKYYRAFDKDATTIDIASDYLYVFLDDAQCHFLMKKNSGDSRLGLMMQIVGKALEEAIGTDLEESEDEDIRIIPQVETGLGRWNDFGVWDEIGY